MMTTETMTREERLGALEQFARTTPEDSVTSLPVPVTPPHAMQVVGAQAVAVRRDEVAVLQKLKVLAAAAGEDWYYRFPVQNRKQNRTDWIEGPSIKLANDLARLYGNCEVDCRAQDLGSVVLYHARFLDLETGFALTRPFQQRKGASKMGGDAQRQEDITFQIGASKAIRNVVVNALQTFADFAFAEARNALVDKIGKDLVKWRERTIEKLSARIDIVRVEAVIGRSAEDWLAPDVARVIAMGKAVEDGMATLDETFPPIRTMNEENTGKVLDQFADEQAMVNTKGGAEPDSTVQTGEAEPNPPASSVALQRSCIDTALRLAVNPQLSEQEKMEQLDHLAPTFATVPGQFVTQVAKTAAEVARGKLKAVEARRYLEGMMK